MTSVSTSEMETTFNLLLKARQIAGVMGDTDSVKNITIMYDAGIRDPESVGWGANRAQAEAYIKNYEKEAASRAVVSELMPREPLMKSTIRGTTVTAKRGETVTIVSPDDPSEAPVVINNQLRADLMNLLEHAKHKLPDTAIAKLCDECIERLKHANDAYISRELLEAWVNFEEFFLTPLVHEFNLEDERDLVDPIRTLLQLPIKHTNREEEVSG